MKLRRFHCSYHKCLTVYYAKVMHTLFNKILFLGRGYRHFNSLVEDFYREGDNYCVASVNNHALDLTKLGDCRISRFVRDPRDLIISGYFYHKRGAEPWCNVIDPTDERWKVVNGTIPDGMGMGHSFSTYLNSLSQEDGLIAEIEFRGRHLDSMSRWPVEDPRIKTFRYEDILGNESEVYREIFSFYELSWPVRKLGITLAERFSAQARTNATKHIRNPEPAQWKKHFSPKVSEYFASRYDALLKQYGYLGD